MLLRCDISGRPTLNKFTPWIFMIYRVRFTLGIISRHFIFRVCRSHTHRIMELKHTHLVDICCIIVHCITLSRIHQRRKWAKKWKKYKIVTTLGLASSSSFIIMIIVDSVYTLVEQTQTSAAAIIWNGPQCENGLSKLWNVALVGAPHSQTHTFHSTHRQRHGDTDIWRGREILSRK